MRDWNVVITLLPDGYRDAVRILSEFGAVSNTQYRDVLVMRVDCEAHEFHELVHDRLSQDATLANSAARVIPVTEKFCFESAEDFRRHAQAAAAPWVVTLAGKSFYVRMHRRGFSDTLNSHEEESALGRYLIERAKAAGLDARVRFDSPDFVVAIETVGHDAGLSIWSRDDLERYELLRFE